MYVLRPTCGVGSEGCVETLMETQRMTLRHDRASWSPPPSCLETPGRSAPPALTWQTRTSETPVLWVQYSTHSHKCTHTHRHLEEHFDNIWWQISFAIRRPKVQFTNAEAHYLLSLCLVQLNPHRMTWARKRCAVLTQELFSLCHAEVPFQQYYDWCVFDACGWVTALICTEYLKMSCF